MQFRPWQLITESEMETADVCRAMRQGSGFRNFSPALQASRMPSFSARSFARPIRSAALRDLAHHVLHEARFVGEGLAAPGYLAAGITIGAFGRRRFCKPSGDPLSAASKLKKYT